MTFNDLCTKSSSTILAILCYGRTDTVYLLLVDIFCFVFDFGGKMKEHLPSSYKLSFL